MTLNDQGQRLQEYCVWADGNFAPVEFLLPQIQVQSAIQPFAFERRFAESGAAAPAIAELAALNPWPYQIEFGSVSTRGGRDHDEWIYHRYRASTLIGLAAEIAGDRRGDLSVTDVACHCGIFALEFAELGFGKVTGIDLREENIVQAQFLAERFGVPNTRFSVGNARDIGQWEKADIMFCGGLVYHVTFPIELLKAIYDRTNEFAIIDTVAQRHPFSGFLIVAQRNVSSSLEGDLSVEFSPTYRGMIDTILAAGFQEVYEIIGDLAAESPHYKANTTRSFLAVKNSHGLFKAFRDRTPVTIAPMAQTDPEPETCAPLSEPPSAPAKSFWRRFFPTKAAP
jgi:SAM-dependent methyltransferase